MEKREKVELSSDLVNELKKLGHIGMTIDDVVRGLVTHVSTCDIYLNQDQ